MWLWNSLLRHHGPHLLPFAFKVFTRSRMHGVHSSLSALVGPSLHLCFVYMCAISNQFLGWWTHPTILLPYKHIRIISADSLALSRCSSCVWRVHNTWAADTFMAALHLIAWSYTLKRAGPYKFHFWYGSLCLDCCLHRPLALCCSITSWPMCFCMCVQVQESF